jgi:hypothetical protein
VRRVVDVLAKRGQPIEALFGLVLADVGVWMIYPPAAFIVPGAVIFTLALWGRRIV